MMINEEVKRQMQIILQGAAQVVSEEELKTKIERSIRTGKPLTIKLALDSSAPDIHLGHAAGSQAKVNCAVWWNKAVCSKTERK